MDRWTNEYKDRWIVRWRVVGGKERSRKNQGGNTDREREGVGKGG